MCVCVSWFEYVCASSLLEAKSKVNSGLTLVSSALSHLKTHMQANAWVSPHLPQRHCFSLSCSHLPPPKKLRTTNTQTVYTHTHTHTHTARLPRALLSVMLIRWRRWGGEGHAWIMTHSSAPLATATVGLRLPGMLTHTLTHGVPRWPSHPHKHFPRTQRLFILSALSLTRPHPCISHIQHVWPWERILD